ncbi:MAG: hypothetical protein EA402_04720 [Planctomycetota bacterium]|nr:MAG: hypothetical protein EA402_04720 [Planctomycetota bacterium]
MPVHFLAIVRAQLAEQVFLDLAAQGQVEALVAEEVQGSGTRTTGIGSEVELLPKVAISGIVESADLDQMVQALRTHACTGRSGDGKIFCFPVISDLD